MGASIQATFGFDTSKGKSDLNSLEQHSRSVSDRIKSNFKGSGGFQTGVDQHIKDTNRIVQNVDKVAAANDLAARKVKVNWDSVRSFNRSISDFATGTAKQQLRGQDYFNDVIRRRGPVPRQSFSDFISSHFKRDSEKRAELAFSQFASSLVSGNVGGAFENLTRRVSGLGLGIAVGLGVGVTVVAKLSEQLRATAEAYGDLESRVRRPLTGMGIEGLKAELTSVDTLVDNFNSKITSVGSRFRDALVRMHIGTYPEGEKPPADELKRGFERQREIEGKLIGAEIERINIKEQGLKVSEEDAEIAKTELAAKEKMSKIDSESLDRKEKLQKLLRDDEETKKQFGDVMGLPTAVKKAYEDEIKLIGQRDDEKKASVERDKQLDQETIRQKHEIENAATAVKRQEAQDAITGQTADEQKRQALFDQLGLLKDQLMFSKQLTAEKRAQLLGEHAGVQAQILNNAQQNFGRPVDLANQLESGRRFRQNRRDMLRDIQMKLNQDNGLAQSDDRFRNFKQEDFDDAVAKTNEQADQQERMRYYGMTKSEAEQLVQNPNGAQLGNLPEAVANAIKAVMEEFWGRQ